MARAKYKPAVRRLKRSAIDAEKASIERWSRIAEMHEPGTFVHQKAMQNVKAAQLRIEELRCWDTP